LGLVIAGCVDYGFVGKPDHHQTGFAYEIARKAAANRRERCCAIDFWGRDVAESDLRIVLYIFGGDMFRAD
jgi:hypothetical protein